MGMSYGGKRWTLPLSLRALEQEANLIAPRRSKASDGSIGDQAHASRKSDHNPSGDWVHAIDLTHDPRNGFDAHAHARNIAARHDGRIEYIISNRKIAERESGFRWRNYDGENPHTKHAHFSIRHTTLARYDTSKWLNAIILFPTPTPPVYVPPAPTPKPTPAPPVIIPAPPVINPPTYIEDDEMSIFRDHTGAIWLIYGSGERRHLSSMDEVNVLRMTIAPKYIDLGANAIQSQIILNNTRPL